MFAADGQQGASGQLLSDRYQQAVDPPRLVAGEQLARGTATERPAISLQR